MHFTSLTESIMKALDEGNFACSIFADLQKAFNIVDQNILLTVCFDQWL